MLTRRIEARRARHIGYPRTTLFLCLGSGRAENGKDWRECCASQLTDLSRTSCHAGLNPLHRCDGCGDWRECVPVEDVAGS